MDTLPPVAKFDAKSAVPIDVLVLGDHPAASLAAALLRHDGKPPKGDRAAKPKLRVVRGSVADAQPDDRLVTINPALFTLHPLLSTLANGVGATPVFGVRFLADDAGTASEYRVADPVVHVGQFRRVRDAVAALADAAGVEAVAGAVQVHRVDEAGVDVTVGKHRLRPTALVLAGRLPADQQATLGMPDGWAADVVHRVTSMRCKSRHLTPAADVDRPLMPMSLDLCNRLCWGWLVPGDGEFQLTVEQAMNPPPTTPGVTLLTHWAAVLQKHGVLSAKFTVDPAAVTSVDLPLAGALAHEGVASRTLLVGPAGGFYSACGEDVYPGCWSAVFAADVLRKALKRGHLQDELGDYRQVWRTTLGDYLRGPQQNLRLLLPLVYRNPVMTARLAEAILLSKSVVR